MLAAGLINVVPTPTDKEKEKCRKTYVNKQH
jgi:hypothetical protein